MDTKRLLTVLLAVPVLALAGAVDSLWLRLYSGSSSNQFNQAAAVYHDTIGGYIYVCGAGEADSWPGVTNMLTAKYTEAGQFLWSMSYGGNTGSQDDMAHAIAVDGAGNVYVAGVTRNTAPRVYDISYVKYSPTGQQLWARKTMWPGDDAVYDMAFGPDGFLYMCGVENRNTALATGFLVMKVSPATGDTVWTRSYILDSTAYRSARRNREFHPSFFDDYGSWDNCATALAFTPGGNIVVTGFGLDFVNDLEMETWTMAFTPAGDRLWATTYHNPLTIYHEDDAGFDVVVAQTGDVYVAGFDYFETGGDYQGYNFAVQRYSSTGSLLNWRSINVGVEDGDEFAAALTLDDSTPQNIYVTGMLAYPIPVNDEIATFKFAPDLTPRWGAAGALWGGPSDDVGYAITYRRGRVYVAGRRGLDIAAIGYTADNIIPKDTLWTWTWNAPERLEAYAAALAVKDSSSIIVAGQAQRGTTPDWTSLVLTKLFYARLDMATTRLYAPDSVVPFGSTVTPRAQLKNLGNSAVLYRAYMGIGSQYRDSFIATVRLEPGDSTDISFRDWTALEGGTLTARCSVALAGDVNPANNAITRSVRVDVRDAGTRRIIAPLGEIPINTRIQPLAMVFNNGSGQVSFDVSLTITDGYSDIVRVNLAPGDSVIAQFRDWLAPRPGTWTVSCSTRLVGDQYPENDRVRAEVTVTANDVGPTAIIAPVGTVDSGTMVVPEATVYNFGNFPAAFETKFTVEPFYSRTEWVDNLEPGESTRVVFPAFRAEQVGSWRGRCQTLLIGDDYPANDTLSAGFVIRGSGGPPLDVGVTAITAPGALIDSGTPVRPRVMVRNFTASPVETPVHFIIRRSTLLGSISTAPTAKGYRSFQLYHDSVTVQLNPDEEVPVEFSEWVASPAETLQLLAYTALNGDENPQNDSQTGQTIVRRGSTQLHDVGAVAIVAPPDTVDSGAVVQPTLRVKNFGTQTETFTVRFTISDGYADEIQINLAAGATANVTFANWQATQTGTFAKRGWTELAGDENPQNDTLTGTVTVPGSAPVRDVGTIAILAPADTVDSGTVVRPAVQVKNFGTQTETFTVRFTIGDGYSDQTDIVLPAGATTDVVFNEWQANTTGTFAKRGWTELGGDENPQNDTLTGTVAVRASAPQVRDIGALGIFAPPDTVDSGAVFRPTLRVKNFGTQTEAFQVRFEIEDGYSDETNVVLPAGAATDVVFNEWRASRTGTFAKTGWSELDGDQNPHNDTARGRVTVRSTAPPYRDVGVIAIVAPPDTFDQGSTIRPTIRVKNFGAGTEVFRARFEISDGYSAEADVVLPGGASSDVTFEPWTPQQSGTFTKRGWTELDGDQNPQNDTMTGRVVVLRTAVSEPQLPAVFAITEIKPNPTRTGTIISLALPATGRTRLAVFSATGTLVKLLSDVPLPPGRHSFYWNGHDDAGRPVKPGAYFVQAESGGQRRLLKLTVTR